MLCAVGPGDSIWGRLRSHPGPVSCSGCVTEGQYQASLCLCNCRIVTGRGERGESALYLESRLKCHALFPVPTLSRLSSEPLAFLSFLVALHGTCPETWIRQGQIALQGCQEAGVGQLPLPMHHMSLCPGASEGKPHFSWSRCVW